MRDLAAVADELGIEYRIIGGQMVRLHVALAGVAEPVARVTQNTDIGIETASARDPRLVPGLESLGYSRPGASNRFVRTTDSELELVIDVPAPAYGRWLIPNQQHGDIVLRAHRQRLPDLIEWRDSGVQGDAAAILRADFARPAGGGAHAATRDRAEQTEIRALTLAVLRT